MRLTDRGARRLELSRAPVDDHSVAQLIDDYYTDFEIDAGDRDCLERFLSSSDVEVRREALLALVFSTGTNGPKFTGYSKDALVLHVLALVEDSEAKFTAISVLIEMSARGDVEATEILKSLSRNKKWRAYYGR